MSLELVAVGSSQFLLGFALAGVETVLANTDTVMDRVQEHKNAGIIILDESLLHGLAPHDVEALQTSVTPVIVPLAADSAEHTKRLRQTIKTTLGVDLFT